MLLVITTFPDAPTGRLIGTALVEEKLAACVNLLPRVESFFFWKGKKETANEVIGLLKTSEAAYPRLEARLNELHPYDVPEIIALPITQGLKAYVDWVRESTELKNRVDS
ncbi:MAG: divalent-cation tolerance protein CutA [Verrucomicrobiales bacterium]